jgi:ring-1,2-phenylacetyl-CoA epoxidase subunit PaaC
MNAFNHNDALYRHVLHLADNALILAQRNAEWCGHGPVLEQDIAITNISLDLIGQSRSFFQYAAEIKGGDATEDTVAYLRTEREYLNCLLVEQPRGDWAATILRQFLFSAFQDEWFTQLRAGKDQRVAAIAEKSLKEIRYHVRWSSEWVIRLGDGTEESHRRMLEAIDLLWRYTGECFMAAAYEKALDLDPSRVYESWLHRVQSVLEEARLPVPSKTFMQSGGKDGRHSEHLGYILSDLQYLQRTYPGQSW